MTSLAVSVEGSTEEEFVKAVLADYLGERDIGIYPVPLGRARGKSGGGNVTVERLAHDMASLLHDYDAVTSLVDLYGFRNRDGVSAQELEQRLFREIDRHMHRDTDPSKVFPYVQQYEFEGLLFSNTAAFCTIARVRPEEVAELEKVRQAFPTPEDIDDGRQTAPSKRIVSTLRGYNKRNHGPLVAKAIGLPSIRAECPRFDRWVSWMEALGAEA